MLFYWISLLIFIPIFVCQRQVGPNNREYSFQHIICRKLTCSLEQALTENVNITGVLRSNGFFTSYHPCVKEVGSTEPAKALVQDHGREFTLKCYVKKADYGRYSNTFELHVEHNCNYRREKEEFVLDLPLAHQFEGGVHIFKRMELLEEKRDQFTRLLTK
ncbi:unnamed protein product [Bursaphelenchus xylophilus]|uniref:(pine wood nematode) hypothetical protein n=1 Tax=Bursaphelenchus xylophilus TaxID=6326 RepID=A0A1I7RYT0_BURXY|nr:unnamed protein product [Bursaphelenchus xylophilus]CAG9092283.1 unnamed protein product [Bursaphelenchus xylophilus]